MESELIRQARSYAEIVFQQEIFVDYTYHNLEHTKEVVQAVELIGVRCGLGEDELESATLAAWLHDTGYAEGADDHEQAAVTKAREMLLKWGAGSKKIMEISEAILATQMPQQPLSMISKVICDADLIHLAGADCLQKNQKLREEWAKLRGHAMTDEEWITSSMEFMKAHKYHTPYGQTILEPAKNNNIMLLSRLLEEINNQRSLRANRKDSI